MNGFVVVDASLAFKWLVSEEHSEPARAISRSWASAGIQAAAPYLMPVEVTNALHRRVERGELTVEDAVRLLGHLLASGIELRDEPALHVRALQLASQLRQGAAGQSRLNSIFRNVLTCHDPLNQMEAVRHGTTTQNNYSRSFR